ncbi:unnamed protein product [Ceutorhynchus assimilis]|uniref:NOL9 N-terminal domain-containing protein n=1 Tax=Ceutorhynchus assimilis TaxID=467358 RepID=A0A9N9N191_9CUCU|nr:unnamed protein product [Ceutorhynchus assimilis]
MKRKENGSPFLVWQHCADLNFCQKKVRLEIYRIFQINPIYKKFFKVIRKLNNEIMANLDVNYLEELRQTFYSADHRNQVPTKGKKEQKHKSKPKITLPKVSSNTQSNGIPTISTIIDTPHYVNGKKSHETAKKQSSEAPLKGKKNLKSSEKIKNRPDTPFKLKKPDHNENPAKGTQLSVCEVEHENKVKGKKKLKSKLTFSETTSSEKIKNRIDTPFKLKKTLNNENPGRGTKRRLSDAEQEVKPKKKKEKPTISKGVQLNFSEDETVAEEFIEKRREKPKINGKGVVRKKKVSWTSETEAVEEKKRKTGKKKKFANLNPVIPSETKPKINTKLVEVGEAQQNENLQISIINNTETAHDFYDNNKLNVKGMNLQRFCNLFVDSYNEHFDEIDEFKVPKKFYKSSKNDNKIFNIGTVEIDSKSSQKQIELDEAIASEDNTESVSDNEENQIVPNNEIIETNQSCPPKILKLTNNNQLIIIPEPNQLIHFHGLFNLKVLYGKVEILGATLTQNSPEKKIYSPRGTSLLYIKNTHTQYCSDTIKISSLIATDLLNIEDKNLAFDHHSAILLCQELKEPYIDFIETHMPQIMFPEATLGPRVDFQLSGNWNKTLEYSNLWENVFDSKTVICGGKGVGKSTYLRYLVNLLLGKFPEVRVVDLDSGQLILSHINIGHDIQQYSKSVRHLTEILDEMPLMPTLINFPGYTQGFGLDLSANSLKMLQPQIVIEIKSKNPSKNYKTDLTADFINSYDDILGHEDIQVNYKHFTFDSLCEKNEAWAIEARPSREICVLSYFGQMMSESTKSLTSHDLSMFTIDISALNIVNFAGDVINPLVVNGCLVALCSLEEKDVFVSYGLGLVRGLDLENDYLVLLTPEKDLEKVTHLVLTSVSTPPSLLMSANGVRGNIPFVNKGELVDFGQFTKRSYLPPSLLKRS